MHMKNGMKLAVLAAAFVLVGGGCAFLGEEKPSGPVPAEETAEKDASGDSLSEQAEIVVEAALDESEFEADAAGDGEADADLFTDGENELDNLEGSYDESEL